MKEKTSLFLKDLFSINENKATKEEIKENIIKSSKLKGTNMCILVLAIIISCVGLNMNSSEIIIGAMLISPMMGAIIGVGYALATANIKFFKTSFVALAIQIFICVITSVLYFLITPITVPSAALISRTTPMIWDVIIAIVGGLAGGIGVTRKEKGNILTGVAIATGLIPPLSTVGYGISVLNTGYILGSLYLFLINAFFICISSMFVFKIMKMPKRKGETEKEEKVIKRDLVIISIVMIIPSILLAYPVVKKTAIEYDVKNYLNNEFKFESTQIVKSTIDVKNKKINVALIGKILDKNDIINLTNSLKKYKLEDMNLKITQTEVQKGITKDEIKELIENEAKNIYLNKENKKSEKEEIENIKEKANINLIEIKNEMLKFSDKIKDCTITNNKTVAINDSSDQTLIVTLILKDNLTSNEDIEVEEILKKKLGENIIINKTIK